MNLVRRCCNVVSTQRLLHVENFTRQLNAQYFPSRNICFTLLLHQVGGKQDILSMNNSALFEKERREESRKEEQMTNETITATTKASSEIQTNYNVIDNATQNIEKPSLEECENNVESVEITNLQGNIIEVKPIETFEELSNVPHWLRKGLNTLKYPSTMGIQKYTIPLLDQGHDVIGLAPTGSGKTIAFAVPALKKIQRNEEGIPSVLVLAPTRELVQQTTTVFKELSSGAVRIGEAYGGSPRMLQSRRLEHGCDVLVACPGRLKDFLTSGVVSLNKLSFLVFDEADRLLDMGFQTQLDEILTYVNPNSKIQRMMWSATWPDSVQQLARNYLSENRLLIRVGASGTGQQVNKHITQNVIFCESFNERIDKLCELIDSGKIDDTVAKLLIFVERQTDTQAAAEALSQRLNISQKYVGIIHGGLPQSSRDRVLHQFKENYIRLLVATDVASRGLDIPDVTCVINFQAPKTIDSYCHRIGRTGRARRKGEAFTFICSRDGSLATPLIEYLTRCEQNVPEKLHHLAKEFDEHARKREHFRHHSLSDLRRRGVGRSRERNQFNFNRNTSSSYDKNFTQSDDML